MVGDSAMGDDGAYLLDIVRKRDETQSLLQEDFALIPFRIEIPVIDQNLRRREGAFERDRARAGSLSHTSCTISRICLAPARKSN